MKTLAYNPTKEVMTAITVLILSLAALTTVKAQENATMVAMGMYKQQFALYQSNTGKVKMNETTSETTEKEDALTIEPWMNSNNYWGAAAETEVVEPETALEIEAWMGSNNYWGAINATEALEYEEPLAIEQWMHCDTYWMGIKNCIATELELAEKDSPASIENWMNSNEYWGVKSLEQLASK